MRLRAPFLVLFAMAALAGTLSAQASYPHATEPIGTVREIYDGVLSPERAVTTFRNIDRLFPSRRIPASTRPRPLPAATTPLGPVTVEEEGVRYGLDEFMEANRVSGLLVLQNGLVKLERYRLGNTERTRWMSMSVAKSVTSTLFGAAVRDWRVLSLTDPVTGYVPSLAGSAYEGVSIRDVLMMSSGVRWRETYTDPTSDRRALLEAQIAQRPGGAIEVMRALPRAAPPGTVNRYSTGETQIAAEVLYSALGGPLADYLHEQIWEPYGMEADATWWLESPDGVEIGGSGFSAVLRDYGRLGQFILEDGVIDGERVLPEGWVSEASTPKVLIGGRPLDYGYLWWTSTSDAGRRDQSFSGEGIHGQFLYVNPALNVVIVIWSARPRPSGGGIVDEWAFFDAVSAALR
jgi:CubicO group peptidase (beta-lactamase class C family)